MLKKQKGMVLSRESEVEEGILLINNLVKTGAQKNAPLLGIQGGISSLQIFHYLKLADFGADGQIQLTDAMNSLSHNQEIYS